MTSPLLERADALALSMPASIVPESPLIDGHVAAMIDDAAAAGFSAVTIATGFPTFPGYGVPDDAAAEAFFAALADAPLPVVGAEVIILDLFAKGDQEDDAKNVRMLDLAARAGEGIGVTTVCFHEELPPWPEVARHVGRVCDLAAERGLRISFEFLPFSGVSDIATALQVVEVTDRDNLGIVLDPWHWFRGTPDVEALRRVPPERIHLLQLDDAPAEPAQDIIAETGDRLLPGEGAIDLMEILRTLDEIGAAPLVASEVFSPGLRALGFREYAQRQYDAARALMDRYRDQDAATAGR
jgi:sugar phosphate isomerase/epimerase